MSVPTLNFTWEQGEDLLIKMTYKSGTAGNEVAVNLTGYKVRMDLRTADTAATRVFTFNSDDITEVPSVDNTGTGDNEITLGSDGTINILVPRSLTLAGGSVNTAMAGGTSVFAYDVFLRDTSNLQKKILSGTVTVNKSQTLWA